MISKLLISLVALAVILGAAGFAVLAAWDVPVHQTQVEKTPDSGSFLKQGQ